MLHVQPFKTLSFILLRELIAPLFTSRLLTTACSSRSFPIIRASTCSLLNKVPPLFALQTTFVASCYYCSVAAVKKPGKDAGTLPHSSLGSFRHHFEDNGAGERSLFTEAPTRFSDESRFHISAGNRRVPGRSMKYRFSWAAPAFHSSELVLRVVRRSVEARAGPVAMAADFV